jgi:hypothetical protein
MPAAPRWAVRKYGVFTPTEQYAMDAERINLIGTQLQDLNQRTLDLRGYL